jgi:transcriptional regulator with XRE-family HTH domain
MTDTTLSEVLEGYASDTPDGNDQETLKRWMDNNPEFADELMDFAAARAFARNAYSDPLPDETHYAEIGMSVLRAALVPNRGLESLAASAEKRGWKKPEFAQRLGISLSLLMYLEKRRVLFQSIPESLVKKIAGLLETSEQAIASYLSLQPAAGEASFKSPTRPEEVEQKDFADAVLEDQTLTAAEKQKLLSEK